MSKEVIRNFIDFMVWRENWALGTKH